MMQHKLFCMKEASRRISLVQTAMKVMGRPEKLSLQSIYVRPVLRQARRILSDLSHMEYELLPSGRRYTIPKCKLNCFKNSFVSTSAKTLNYFM